MADNLFDSSILSNMQQSSDFITNLSSTEYSTIGRGLYGTILSRNEGES